MRQALPVLFALAFAAPAFAQDAPPELMGAESCFTPSGLMKTLRKGAELKPAKRDRVQFHTPVWVEPEDGELPPSHVELRDAGQITRFDFAPTGENRFATPSLGDALARASETAEVCLVDPAREGRPRSERGYRGSVSMDVLWMRTPGTHDLADIEDGLKDGRSHYKKMAGAMAMLVPKFTHIAVRSPGSDTPPAVIATRGGVDVGAPELELYNGTRFVSLDAIEALDADAVRIDGPYEIGPSPSVKQVKRFTGG